MDDGDGDREDGADPAGHGTVDTSDAAGGSDGGADVQVSLTRMETRDGGWIGYSDEAIFVDEGGERRVRIDHANVTRISLSTVEWDLAVMSVLLVGVGTYVAATRNAFVGIGFGAVGVWSCWRTYRQRHELRVHVDGRHKPVTVHPVEPGECHDTLADVADLERRGGG